MNTHSINTEHRTTSTKVWLDKAAVLMAFVCGIHCLVTPFLLVALPILGSTFWTNSNFHFWMLLLVVPTTTLAVFSGCRKHKDRAVVICATIGLSILIIATVLESFATSSNTTNAEMDTNSEAGKNTHEITCGTCCSVPPPTEDGSQASPAFPPLTPHLLLNLSGGLFLIIGHIRNFHLCRASKCCDGLNKICR